MPTYDDMLVDELLEGVGDTEIVGAEARTRNPQNIEHLMVGVPVTNIGAGATVDVNVPVNRAFRARKMVLLTPATGNVLLRVNSLKVSNVDQFINSSPIPIGVFTSDATAARLRGDTAQPGVGMDLRVTNAGTDAGDLTGAFFGEAAT